MEIQGDEAIADEADVGQRVFRLGDDLLPVLLLRRAEVDGDHAAAAGQVDVGLEEQPRPVAAEERELVLEIVDQLEGHGVGFGQVADDDPLPGVGPHDDRDHQVAAVFGNLAFVLPLGMLGPIVDQHVGRLRRADAMVEELVVEVQRLELGAGLGLLVAAVEEALAVLGPGGVGELGPLQLVGQLPAGGDFQDVPDRPVAAGLGAAVGQVLAVVAEAHLAQRDRAVFRPGVGVDQDPRPGVPGAPASSDSVT